ncbi:MAG: nitroreductase [Acidimicrobiia bacterium]|nr:nitroreductase [Acidimicrobiia bacterium]
MEFYEAIRRRKMVRRYVDSPVEREAVDRILDAARRGPSAGFAQGVEFVAVTEADRRMAIAEAAGEPDYVAKGFTPWLSTAPVHVVVAVNVDRYLDRYGEDDKSGIEEWTAPYWWVDAGAALMVLLLAATEEGLAAGFLGGHSAPGLEQAVGLPDRYRALGVVTIGHPDRAPVVGSATRARRPRSDVVHLEQWGGDGESG